jgi:FkbM family methyltransferase
VVRKLEGDYQALLLDADGRAGHRIAAVLRVNPLEGRFIFQHGAISREPGEVRFAQRGGMGSSLDFTDPAVSAVEVVKVIDAANIAELMAPPYDLIKSDVEGAEIDFMEAYESVYRQAKWLIVEWHSWDMEGLKEKVVREGFESRGFKMEAVLKPKKSGLVDGLPLSTGTHMYARI